MQKFYDIEDDKNSLTKKITQRKQSVVKDAKKSNRIKISINWIICWVCNNKDARNNVCIDIRTSNLLICAQIWFLLCHTHYFGLLIIRNTLLKFLENTKFWATQITLLEN